MSDSLTACRSKEVAGTCPRLALFSRNPGQQLFWARLGAHRPRASQGITPPGAIPEGPGTWRTAGRKLVAGGRVVAETMEGHME